MTPFLLIVITLGAPIVVALATVLPRLRLARSMAAWLRPRVPRLFAGAPPPAEGPPAQMPDPAVAAAAGAAAGPNLGLIYTANPPTCERIGLILVHGIGEQRRFEHLDSQLRDLIGALQRLQELGQVQQVSVDISASGAAPFQAEQDTWNAGPGPSVTVLLKHILNGAEQEARLLVHEVWWADVNERYSIAKQFRFWLWGLGVWAAPARPMAAGLGTAARVAPPKVPGRTWVWDRLRLWLVGGFFVLLGYSVGAITFLITRLLDVEEPSVLRTIANYISAVKLYNQERRFGPGLWWSREEFLDSIGEPPRVSIRRRMIRAIADVACNRYHRWYVLAHSQGSVVAFNGLMETAYAWPGYLDEQRWANLKGRHMAGPGAADMPIPQPPIMPRRPGWAAPNEIAYRSRIFGRFRGFLTYGCPLEKFAGLWPALVPISRELAFAADVPWLNIYDPVDPVSGRLLAFQDQPPACCPRAEDLGYAASWWLLVAHLKYLTCRACPGNLGTLAMRWMLTDDPAVFRPPPSGWALGNWFRPGDPQERLRKGIAWFTWIVAGLGLLLLGAIVLPMVWDAMVAATRAISSEVVTLTAGQRSP